MTALIILAFIATILIGGYATQHWFEQRRFERDYANRIVRHGDQHPHITGE